MMDCINVERDATDAGDWYVENFIATERVIGKHSALFSTKYKKKHECFAFL